MAPAIKLRKEHLEAMVQHALEDAPIECCGIVASLDGTSAGIYRARNLHESEFRFEIHPLDYRRIEEAIEARGASVAGTYHSHTGRYNDDDPPGAESVASATDVRMLGFFEPPFVHFVVGVGHRDHPVVRAWHIQHGDKTEQTYELVD